MNKKIRIIAYIFLAVVMFWFVTYFLPKEEINPKASTRHAIEACENIELGIVPGNNHLSHAFGEALKDSKDYQSNYIKIAANNGPLVLDGWGNPLQIMTKDHLKNIPNVSKTLMGKTNNILVWSSGPNGLNEWGNGDDIFITNGEVSPIQQR